MARVNLDLPSYIINAPTGMKKSSYRSVPDADNWRTSEYANGYSSTDRYHDYEREIPPPREYVEDWGAPVPVPMSGSAKYGPSASSSSRRDTTYAAFPEYNPPWGSDYGFLNDNSNSHHREARSHHRARDDVDRDHDHDQWRPAVPGPAVAVVEPETHGWDTRDAGWVPRKPSMTDEDRKWEPAPSWKPTHVQDSGWNRATSKKAKNTAETDWRNRERDRDRDDLNNWTRRSDSSSSKHGHGHGHGHGRRKQSPQRTRSPAESTHSYYSRGRSRSPASPPPQKRPRHDDTTSSPYRRRSPSPTSPRASRKKRGRSISSVSSRSSRSPSPPVVSKPHRLPSASQPVIKYPQQPQPQAIPEQQPTTKSKKKKNKNKRNGAMAPPNALPLSIPAKPTFYPEQANPISGFDADEASSRVFVPKKGFKPIGAPATSSSLKMFFPKDDDDVSMPSSALRAPLPEKPRWWPSPAVPDNPTPTPMRLAEPAPRPAPEIAPEPVPVPQPEPEPQPESIVILLPEPIPEPVLAPEPEPAPEPSPEPSPMDIEAPDENVVDTGGGDTKPALGVYSVINQVGEGTFGKVYKVLNTQTGVHVALKRIRMETEKDGFPVTAMREVKLLQSLNHANIVRLFEMLVDSGSVYMVFEYMDHDLTGILSQTQFTFSEAHLKSLCHQMLGGLAYLHHKGVIHRDIKGSNILLNNRGELKLADFGLARFYQKRRRTDYTNRVITLWYRPPELLFGATVYGPEVDMWSAGCIMLELYTKKPVFQGNDEMHQLDTIYRIIGTPDAGRWPDIGNLPWYELVKPREAQANRFREMFSRWMSGPALDLGERLLCYDPGRRIGAAEAMEAPYFVSESPEAERPTRLASVQGEWHELETKRERAKKRKKD